jgi:hypothetical protein
MSLGPGRIVLIIGLSSGLFFISGCRERQNKQMLPEKPPNRPELRFSAEKKEWPPRPEGRTNVTDVPWKEIPGALTPSREGELRNAALQDARVRAALGARFAYISAGTVERDKDRAPGSNEATEVRLTFFSHDKNVAVLVLMRGTEVRSVTPKEGYQPPEGVDEIKMASTLAARELHLGTKLRELQSGAIAVFPSQGQPGYGHRVLHVTFNQSGEDLPRYFALVDLTDQKVLSGGPVRQK